MELKDIDGTTKGRAALVSMDLENPGGDLGGPLWQDFEEGDENLDQLDPIARCWSFWEATKDDFPTHTASVIANNRAKYLDYAQMMKQLGVDPTPEKYLDLGLL